MRATKTDRVRRSRADYSAKNTADRRICDDAVECSWRARECTWAGWTGYYEGVMRSPLGCRRSLSASSPSVHEQKKTIFADLRSARKRPKKNDSQHITATQSREHEVAHPISGKRARPQQFRVSARCEARQALVVPSGQDSTLQNHQSALVAPTVHPEAAAKPTR